MYVIKLYVIIIACIKKKEQERKTCNKNKYQQNTQEFKTTDDRSFSVCVHVCVHCELSEYLHSGSSEQD